MRSRSGRSSRARAIGSSSGENVNSRSQSQKRYRCARQNRDCRWRRRRALPRPTCCDGEDFRGSIVMLSNDAAPPVDRPNLSKDYLAGNAPEDWLPLRPDSFYTEAGIDLRLNSNVASIDTKARNVVVDGGAAVPYDRLLLATGAEPVRLPIPGTDQPHVHTLRSLADCGAIIRSRRGAARDRDWRQLYRPRSRGGIARAPDRGSRRRSRATADGTGARSADGRLHPRAARAARCCVSSR